MTTEQTIAGLEFTVQAEGNASDKVVVDSERVLVGSGTHCEIRLPPDQAAAEHVLITFLGGAIYAQARAFQPPPLLNGSPFTETPLSPGSRLQIGQVEITVSIVEIADVAKILHKKPQEKTSPLTYLFAAIAVPISLYVLLDNPEEKEGAGKPDEIPALWEEAPPTCTKKDTEQARAVAREKMVTALGRRERSPFDVQDGVLAVPLFMLASDCFRIAGDKTSSLAMQKAGDRLKGQMEETYRAHQMRLEHSLDTDNFRIAHHETKILLSMLEGQTGAYVTWLSNLERRLQLKIGKETKAPGL
ncbi:MAG TPA: FHA domain-containing protein [Polyangiaceae bacterium]|jgi:hypothetical protein|nr:FHA domain-containing protein [Polyangiaceae bacterium]